MKLISDNTKKDPTPMRTHKGRVLVLGGGMDYIRMFYENGWNGANDIMDADVICFTGGEDVDPEFYGEKALSVSRFNTSRDNFEMEVYCKAVVEDIPMVGICRGGQFLNVMSGGSLWQDVNGHLGRHEIKDTFSGEIIQGMSSTHHQMMRPCKDGKILAHAAKSTLKLGFGQEMKRDTPEMDDVEVVWYENGKSLCFQPHPEFGGYPDCRTYFFDLFDKYIGEAVQQKQDEQMKAILSATKGK